MAVGALDLRGVMLYALRRNTRTGDVLDIRQDWE